MRRFTKKELLKRIEKKENKTRMIPPTQPTHLIVQPMIIFWLPPLTRCSISPLHFPPSFAFTCARSRLFRRLLLLFPQTPFTFHLFFLHLLLR